jgi:nucleolar MIF4G domain-containing protein 1
MKDKLTEEDAEIAALEKRLGLKRKSKSSKSLEDDGLDFLLDGLTDGDALPSSKRKRHENSDWLKSKRRRSAPVQSLSNGEGVSHGVDELDQMEVDGEDSFIAEEHGIESDEFDDDTPSDHEKVFAGFDSDTSGTEEPSQPKVRENPWTCGLPIIDWE